LNNKSAPQPILVTKFQIPQARSRLVTRTRLLERLDTGLENKLILVAAPAGYGKTTLVSGWLHHITLPVTWLSLDEGDNDPKRFLFYLIGALKQIHPEMGHVAGALLHSPQSPPDEIILTALVNEISAAHQPFVFVLDDYHFIHTPAIHKQLTFLLDHQPAHMLLVLATREDPLLPLPRLRARNQVLEIRQEDLRFTTDEVTDFLRQVMELNISVDEITALEHRTEGWVAGLQLAALSMQGRTNLQPFIQSFTGSSRYILDYLIDEVFERQTPEVKDFLLKTSILEQLSEPLCDAVVGQNGSQKILEMLEQANLFIVPLDQSRGWYRYHHLFVELLRHHSRTTDIPQVALHQRASHWYESQGLFRDAVEHSLAAQDWGNAGRLIGAANESMLKQGETVTLLNWLGKIPREISYANPSLCMVYAWAALMASQFDMAAPLLERAEGMAELGSHFLGQVAAAQAFLARAKRDNDRAIEKSEQALALLPDVDITTRGTIAMNLGLAYWHIGQLAKAESVLLQACDLCSKVGNQYSLLTARLFLARVFASRGKLHQALEIDEGLIRSGGQIPILCLAHYDLATIHQEWNNLQKAREHFEQGFALSQRSGNVEFQQAGYLVRAILMHALGDDVEAISAHAEADVMAHDFPAAIRSRVAAFGVQMALARKDPQMLAHWEPQIDADTDAHLFYRFMGLTHPRLLIAHGKKNEAAEMLKALYEKAFQSGWGYGLIVVRILQSLAARNMDEAMQFLSDALRMGQPENFIRSFVDAGNGIVPVLLEATRCGIEPEYTGRILSALGAGSHGKTRTQTGLVEPLSEREIEVLRLVTVGLSNREIAAKLVISSGTAKTHIHNLCGKLGVRNRTEAAMRAKELNLV
jgi:LuxR family transcriptional regulator, maltose regulon positive regulatory protein